MARDTLEIARSLMRRRKFREAIETLRNGSEFYRRNFDYSLLLGTAYLYFGDAGQARENFEAARRIKMRDTDLLLGQAALYLRRGDTASAIGYYLEILEYDPENKTARDALEFVREVGDDYTTICKWADTGKLEIFYPPVGTNYLPVLIAIAAAVVCCVVTFFVITKVVLAPSSVEYVGERGDLSSISLTSNEFKNASQSDVPLETVKYNMTNKQIQKSVELAFEYFQNSRDNAARVEVNRINNSNATPVIKQKVSAILNYVSLPTFDTLQDIPSYADVSKDPVLYNNCSVIWEGRLVNVQAGEKGYTCDLLMSMDDAGRTTFSVPVNLTAQPTVDFSRNVRVLAEIVAVGNAFRLDGRSVYQSIRDALTNQ